MSDTPRSLTDVDITILNAARGILNEQAKSSLDATKSQVRAAVVAEHAEDAIFKFLNTANAYLHREMTYEQIHNQPHPGTETAAEYAESPVPQSLRA